MFLLNVRLYSLICQTAYRVVESAIISLTKYVPPDSYFIVAEPALVVHPNNVYPVLSTIGYPFSAFWVGIFIVSLAYCWYKTSFILFPFWDSKAPPFAFNFTSYLFACHIAYKVISLSSDIVYGFPSSYFAVSFGTIFHPNNVYPVLVAPGSVIASPNLAVIDAFSAIPLFPSNVTVYEFTDQTAYNVISSSIWYVVVYSALVASAFSAQPTNVYPFLLTFEPVGNVIFVW